LLDVLVIGAGPYGLAAAKAARDQGLSTRIVGRHMAFWRENMPAGMFLRSGPDWHLDHAHELTFQRYLDEQQISEDPIPLAVFLGYSEWFTTQAGLFVEDAHVRVLRSRAGHFVAETTNGSIEARQVIAAPGIAHFTNTPEWATEGEHTCDLVDFAGFSGARVLIVGGRQSAYEWAALLSEHGAEHIDVVHRHPKPRFAKVSWSFVDPLIDRTLAQRGWFRTLPRSEQDAIARRFWEVGRLTLEHWLEPRLKRVAIHAGTPTIDPSAYNPDRIVLATGYKADLDRVPYLRPLRLATRNGFPILDEAMQSSLPGLYLPGFTATQDFGPFFGFVKGAPAAASLVARDLT
jgi:lysine/ornithine N-monooxygenase